MVAQLNFKYSQAVIESKKCLSLSESLASHKIPNDSEMISYISKQMKNTVGIEYPENYFTKNNLLNSNYNDLIFRDLEKYFYLSEMSGYKDSGRDMLKSMLTDNREVETPILIKGKNEIYWQLSGNLQMMAFKVLGIFPLVREIPINANIIP